MIEKWSISIREFADNKPRNAYVYVPEEAKKNPRARFPVLYMFDGHNVFFDEDATYAKSWGMAEFAEEMELPLIIAAVECSHAPNHGRLREYAPFSFEDREYGRIKGEGRLTMEWLVNVFKPSIDENFPTLSQRKYTFIAGSSMGGLMSLYAVMEYNHIFSRAAALSPSLWAGGAQLNHLLRMARLRGRTMVYIDYGSREMHWRRGIRTGFIQAVSIMMERGVMVEARIIPGGEHNEASWQKQVPFFIDSLLYEL